jgi:OHCU decarboxylase
MATVVELDAVPSEQAAEMLQSCCGSSRWVSAMVARRPFGTRDAVLSAADALWRGLTPADWQEAFRHHPRIGEQRPASGQTDRSRAWSTHEQGGIRHTDIAALEALAAVNREYEQRFGWIYIVNAEGRSADEMLALARQRMTNSPETEVQVAASEHEQIMLNRLQKLLVDDRPGGFAP